MSRGDAAQASRDQWLSDLRDFEQDGLWRKPRSRPIYRTLLSRLHALVLRTPGNWAQDFERHDERRLTMLSCSAAPKLNISGPTGLASTGDRLLDAAVMLRALEALLLQEREEVWSDAPDCWLTHDETHYVIPVRRAVVKEGGARRGQFLKRRGLLHHRIIPTRIGDVNIVVDTHPDISLLNKADRHRTFGVALFSGFDLVSRQPTSDTFLVTSASCAGGMEGQIDQHCDDARAGGCDTLLWPELTMAPSSVSHLLRRLSDAPLEAILPSLVVAGSWHVEDGGDWYNKGSVFTGRGELLLDFGKNRKFALRTAEAVEEGGTEKKTYWEAIKTYGAIHVLVTDDELIAFAICKDFCAKDHQDPPPVTTLDVDLVLVPAMGNESSILAHRAFADDMKSSYGTRTVVAQQAHLPEAKLGSEPGGASSDTSGVEAKKGKVAHLGYILKAPEKPLTVELSGLETGLNFTTFQRSKGRG